MTFRQLRYYNEKDLQKLHIFIGGIREIPEITIKCTEMIPTSYLITSFLRLTVKGGMKEIY